MRVAFVTLTFLAGCATTKPASGEATLKIAIVDIARVMAADAQWSKAVAAIRADVQGKRASHEAEAARTLPGTVARDSLERQFQAEVAGLQREEAALSGALFQRIEAVVRRVADAGGYDLVLEVGTPELPNVLYADGPVDITESVIDAYNADAP